MRIGKPRIKLDFLRRANGHPLALLTGPASNGQLLRTLSMLRFGQKLSQFLPVFQGNLLGLGRSTGALLC